MSQCFQHHLYQAYNLSKKKRILDENSNRLLSLPLDSSNIRTKDEEDEIISKDYSFSMKFHFNLIPQLTDEYRKRHNLSLSDYEKILKSVNAKDLLKMAMKDVLEISTSSIKSTGSDSQESGSSNENLSYLGSAQFNKKIEKFLVNNKKLSTIDKLVARGDEHVPQLPVHFVSKETFSEIPAPSQYYDFLFKWRNIYLVPYAYYNGYIKMIKVIPIEDYEKVYLKCEDLLNRPPEYLVGKMVYCGTKEYVLLQTKENHNFICSMPLSDFKDLENELVTNTRELKKS
jgi:hypothetical protein